MPDASDPTFVYVNAHPPITYRLDNFGSISSFCVLDPNVSTVNPIKHDYNHKNVDIPASPRLNYANKIPKTCVGIFFPYGYEKKYFTMSSYLQIINKAYLSLGITSYGNVAF